MGGNRAIMSAGASLMSELGQWKITRNFRRPGSFRGKSRSNCLEICSTLRAPPVKGTFHKCLNSLKKSMRRTSEARLSFQATFSSGERP